MIIELVIATALQRPLTCFDPAACDGAPKQAPTDSWNRHDPVANAEPMPGTCDGRPCPTATTTPPKTTTPKTTTPKTTTRKPTRANATKRVKRTTGQWWVAGCKPGYHCGTRKGQKGLWHIEKATKRHPVWVTVRK